MRIYRIEFLINKFIVILTSFFNLRGAVLSHLQEL